MAITEDQAYAVYKFLDTPQQMLVQGLSKMSPQMFRDYRNEVYLELRPDRNPHVLASDAFLHFKKACEITVKKMNLLQ